ncbi:hypothetical protein ACFRC1_05955 [Streptomyces sp. NPDC056626]|uniref:hypothetical protein n=1 Tax=Streptomyces sp. NPDC056626 TaxID=3345880 RepID=UPI00368D7881
MDKQWLSRSEVITTVLAYFLCLPSLGGGGGTCPSLLPGGGLPELGSAGGFSCLPIVSSQRN